MVLRRVFALFNAEIPHTLFPGKTDAACGFGIQGAERLGLTEVGKNSSIIRINEKLASFDTWNAIDIEKRQGLLIDLAKEIWKISYIDLE